LGMAGCEIRVRARASFMMTSLAVSTIWISGSARGPMPDSTTPTAMLRRRKQRLSSVRAGARVHQGVGPCRVPLRLCCQARSAAGCVRSTA